MESGLKFIFLRLSMKRSEEFFDKLTDKEKDLVLKSIMVLKQIKSISELQEIIDATETIDGKNFIRYWTLERLSQP